VLDANSATAFATYVRAWGETSDSEHHSLDAHRGEEAYFHIKRYDEGRWRFMFSRMGGDVELYVDQQTMDAIVEAITGAIDSASGPYCS
jgi:hypothetical protein